MNRTQIFSALFALALLATAGWGMSKSMHSSNDNVVLNEMALANVEALAQSETSEEFTAATCCIACWDNHSCRACDGYTYSYAHRQ